ncbi:MAG: phenylalanine--tRNA ligase subunit beta [Clostridiales bacterium]|nr:phenylalanine--tRNA ligase subunit beta [Clostridiales bacterium]
MKLPLQWCSDFTNIKDIDIKTFCDRMTDTGSKVEGWEENARDIENVVVGRVVKMERHPDSDHLWICEVDVGEASHRQIVTGAQNVFEGAIVPVAKAPAKLPGGVEIKSGKLRGVVSDGMLCSIDELGLTSHDMPGNDSSGICILGDEFADKIGADIRDALLLRGVTVDFEITPNRPDCLSVIGLAREAAVTFNRDFSVPAPSVKVSGDGDDVSNYIRVDIEAPDLCPRYCAKVVKNVKIEPSPLWMRMRLRAAGVRPINNIVDITNYVMLEYGQPMHAFDYSCLDGAHIIVRRARDGELFRSLAENDTDRPLSSSMLVIADEKKPVALAGVIGGANSEIKPTTTTVVFESANFNGVSVRLSAKAMNIRTESSARFEKGMDPENAMPALLRACELVTMLGAGEVVDGIIDVYPGKKEKRTVKFEPDRINAFLGTDIPRSKMEEILSSLGFGIEAGGDFVTVPSWRGDVSCMNDLAEEIIRIYGYNEVTTTLPLVRIKQGGRTQRQQFELSLHELMCGMGLWETETFSFIGPRYLDMIHVPEEDIRRNCVVISNPLGKDTSIMRTTALPSMLDVLSHNQNYKNASAAMYELATIYIPTGVDTLPEEKKVLVVGMYGGGVDFYHLKGICERIILSAGISGYKTVAIRDNPSYHPGRCGEIRLTDGTVLCVLGQVHPEVAEEFELSGEIYAAEIDVEAIFERRAGVREFRPLPKYPAVWRDFSFVCDEEIEAGSVVDVCCEAGGELVESAYIVDVYRGEQVGEGKKSVSVRVHLRASDRTLTDAEADAIAAKMLDEIGRRLGASLRGR